MQPRERRRAWRADMKRRKAQALVNPTLWSIEFATRNGAYAEHARSHRMVDAVRAFAELEVSNGERKRLLRNGRVIDRVIAPRSITPNHQDSTQECLPIAL